MNSGGQTIYLARHGQAGGVKYNTLTERGRLQARALGRHLSRQGLVFDAAVCGTLPRQQQTLQLALEELRQSPALRQELPELDEVSPRVWLAAGEILRREDAQFRDQFDRWLSNLRKEDSQARQAYLPVLETTLRGWIAGRLQEAPIESFAEFHNRVLQAPARIAALPARNVLAISSGVPIALLIGKATALDIEQSLAIMAQLSNACLSIFEANGERWTVQSWNVSSFLSEEGLLSQL
ncbi:MAG: histidine phosphatase family protein [Leptospirales bacterium]|nr:histidine phosphatase family protein [Leptospirales bacterium]